MQNLEDEIALRNLMARYVDAVNRYDADAWIATWAEDGVWNLMGNPVQGRDNILALWQQMMASFEYALLLPSSCLFEFQGDSATGHWYLHEYSRDLDGNKGTLISRYNDTYVKVKGQWLFQSREYCFIYNGPPDFSGDFTRPA
ncbi:MAG: nuclear transport factor 2 family protein [Gammaproteobacteria bacterium]|nr:nuclear transport factor 2 family protein [Gammaproteobacteria bacterium]